MKNVRDKTKSSNSALSGVVGIALVAAVCVSGTYFTTSSYYKNQQQLQQQEEVEKVAVAMTNDELPDGSYVKNSDLNISAYDMVEIPVTQIPSDAIMAPDEMEGLITKIPLKPNTIVTSDMLVGVDMDEDLSATSRKIDINYLTLNSTLTEGDYIDVMLRTYSARNLQEYSDDVVLSKKKVLSVSANTVTLNLDREEQLQLGLAAVDATLQTGDNDRRTLLYAVALSSASQPKAIETYSNPELKKLVESDENLIHQAQEKLAEQQINESSSSDSNVTVVG